MHLQSLDRGITILELLAREGACSLAELHRASGISKSSIRRLLATLIARRLVRQSLADGKYRAMLTLPVSAGAPVPADHARLVDIAMPIVTELTRRVEWPSDIHVMDGDRMRVLDSTRPLSPFHLYRGVVNRKINIFGAASGMACLAALGDEGFRRIHAHTEGDALWGLERYKITPGAYLEKLEATRQRGYGIRMMALVKENPLGDGLAAIACPVFAGPKLIGAVSMLWPRAFQPAETFARTYAPPLRAATEAIGAQLAVDA